MNINPNNQELIEYYNERAPEYEEFYWGGIGTRLHDPELYTRETLRIRHLLPGLVSGKCLDIACGTGFWLPVYQQNCSSITLIDQSENVLAECEKKINLLGIKNKTEIVQNNLFTHDYVQNLYDCVIAGFLISHFLDSELEDFFHLVNNLLVSSGHLVIIDSIWNKKLVEIGRNKAGIINRKLSDGREYQMYKRYFERDDIFQLSNEFDLEINC